jgi:hypothetical protein
MGWASSSAFRMRSRRRPEQPESSRRFVLNAPMCVLADDSGEASA